MSPNFNSLAAAYEIQYTDDGFPYQRVEVLSREYESVTFKTEWVPGDCRTITLPSAEFYKKFYFLE